MAYTMEIKNFNPSMQYRRFGKTNKTISVITLGGMRYLHGWEEPRNEVPSDMLEQCLLCIKNALKSGINHIETAYGYGKSEHCYGQAFSQSGLQRSDYYLMTKGAAESAGDMRKMVEEQLEALHTDHVDFYGFHGINTREIYENACKSGGPVEELHRMKEEGLIGHVGFSTHAALDVITDSIGTGLFEFVNLHYYYFFQRNWPAITAAREKDMGVFIISPNDKGGRLFEPPAVLEKICAPLTPIQFNARFCLKTDMVHTLSFGMTEPPQFEEMRGVCEGFKAWSAIEESIMQSLESRKNLDRYSKIDGYGIADTNSGINIPEILRFRHMWKCYDMTNWCSYRYNMFQEKGHWFPGYYATEENIDKIDDTVIPAGIPLKEMLREFHITFYKEKDTKN